MIIKELMDPKSIVVIGASNNIQKPGGRIFKNIINGKYKGILYAVNPNETEIQGVKCFTKIQDLPQTDLAIIAITAKYTVETVEILAKEKGVKAFIIISAGFSEESAEGKIIEDQVVKIINEAGACLIGPNCTGILTPNHHSIFTLPIPILDAKGCDFITGSGATSVFFMDAGMHNGLRFANVFTVGNSAQMGVEEILEYLDENFDEKTSSKIKLLYLETINNPQKFLKHTSSLIEKGCRIAAVKSGSSEAGSRAASSHTGALASSDAAVDALFQKAGIVRCYGREELIAVASIFSIPELKGKNIAIITHAGGPAVMLADALSKNGLNVPNIEGEKAKELSGKLFAGASVANPIDFLATGTAEQLGIIIDYCDKYFDEIDAMVVIFGTTGLFPSFDVYEILDQKIKNARKPIYPVLPSRFVANAEVTEFQSKGNVSFPDEVIFGEALGKIFHTQKCSINPKDVPKINIEKIRETIAKCENGYINPELIGELLDAAGIVRAKEIVSENVENALEFVRENGFPVVMKVVGPVHKSDVGGVVLNIKDEETVRREFERLMKIKDTFAVQISKMYFGAEMFAGAVREDKFGHLVFFGLGGIFIEVFKDVQSALAPIGISDALNLIKKLKSYAVIKGVRGQKPINEMFYAEQIARVSALVQAAPEILEMDLNPLLGSPESVIAVDARIRIEK
jgi:acetyltransferase